MNKLFMKSLRNKLFPALSRGSISIEFFPTMLKPFAFNIFVE